MDLGNKKEGLFDPTSFFERPIQPNQSILINAEMTADEIPSAAAKPSCVKTCHAGLSCSSHSLTQGHRFGMCSLHNVDANVDVNKHDAMLNKRQPIN